MDTTPDASPAAMFREAAEQALARHADPADRAAEITALLKAVDEMQPRLTEQRRADVRELRRTLTLREVAERVALSVPRVDQIAKGR